MKESELEEIAKRRGFFWPSFEIYRGCSGFYTYGPLGALLKANVEKAFREFYVIEEGCIAVEAPTLSIEDPWVASGHVKSFTDMTTECGKCGEPYRADHLVEEETGRSMDGKSLAEIGKIIEEKKIKCPKCGGGLEGVYDYNLMFKTYIGPGKAKVSGYLRPETAQTTYMPFKRLFEIGRKKLPLGVIQIGRSFRNEISPRKGLVRLREFSQAEVQFFLAPGQDRSHGRFSRVRNMRVLTLTGREQERKNRKARVMSMGELVKKGLTNPWIAYFLGRSVQLFEGMGIDKKRLRIRQHRESERAFYSRDTWDVEYISEGLGRIELVGIADRGDYDLGRHQELSRESMEVSWEGKKFIPRVMEIAYGIDRPVLCIIESCLRRSGDRVWFRFPPRVSPYQVAVFPLVRKGGLPELARRVFEDLRREGLFVLYDESGSIGRMYYRQDEAGTPCCVTIDYDSLKGRDVTLRDRDNQKQVRVKIRDLPETLKRFLAGEKIEDLGRPMKN